MTDTDLYQSIPELLILFGLLIVLFGAETLGWRLGRGSSEGPMKQRERRSVRSRERS